MSDLVTRLRRHPVICMDKQNITSDAADLIEQLQGDNDALHEATDQDQELNASLSKRIDQLDTQLNLCKGMRQADKDEIEQLESDNELLEVDKAAKRIVLDRSLANLRKLEGALVYAIREADGWHDDARGGNVQTPEMDAARELVQEKKLIQPDRGRLADRRYHRGKKP